ncbi:OstA-like protein [Polluticaenibacter yanchengensis]|uniref:Organic solvent tolerance-like N-terminal domain-containing protein n=1 Tax=Polluticaenibacter yanchengensis TaxID=3014562 RepID=A0ABT4UKR5_9BACT|nr:hypothetical protein [Chitinophagaceae bacterium LY-5]
MSFIYIGNSYGQQLKPAAASRLEILFAERQSFQKIDSLTELQTFAGKVKLKHDKTLFFCDSVILNSRTNILEAFGNIHINDNDSIHTYSDYLRYNTDSKIAKLKKNVRIKDTHGTNMQTQELDYDLNTKIATYVTGGRIITKNTNLTSKAADYYQDVDEVVFRRDVEIIAPDYNIYADSILYNTKTEKAQFISPTTIKTKNNRTIYTTAGYYDLKTGKAILESRPTIQDSNVIISSDYMGFDDETGIAQFKGNFVYTDTVEGISMLAGQAFSNNNTKSFLAFDKPLLIIKQDNDSTFVTADTLYSAKLTDLSYYKNIPVLTDTGNGYVAPDLLGKDSSQNRFFRAWYNVKIFSDSAQAVCDSLFYAGTDSVFRMFKDPVIWGNNSQILADTIYMFTKNRKPEKLHAFFNAFLVNKSNESLYNQVKGKTLNAWFVDGEINYVRTKGNAESVYYPVDDDEQYIGMNKSKADAIDMYFINRKPERVLFIKDLEGTIYPLTQIPSGFNELPGYKWLEHLRPKSKFEMMQ